MEVFTMDRGPLVSIIMPCYNAESTIAESIISVQKQTYENWELLIINDCSTDNSLEIISKFTREDNRIKLFQTDKSVGKPFYPRNVGIEKAMGRYIAFLDSDDKWLSTKLEHQIPVFENDRVGIVFSYYKKFSQNIIRHRVIKSPSEVSFSAALYGNPIGNLTGMYDTEKVGKVYFENVGHEDYVMWLSILNKGFLAKNTNTVEALYRVSMHSVSSDKRKAAIWTWNIYRNVLKLGLLKSCFCFVIYMLKGILNFIK